MHPFCDSDEQNESSSDVVRPFEWLTSPSSLGPILSTLWEEEGGERHSRHSKQRALHLGCGSSMLGEYLVQELGYREVVNADIDLDVLSQTERRWKNLCAEKETPSPGESVMHFVQVDLSTETIPYPPRYFDLVIDKSTLDCTLCSDEATAGLLCEAYRSLNQGGIYVVVSFHHIDLLLPMLRDLPCAEWTVEHSVILRQVEDIVSGNRSTPDQDEAILPPEPDSLCPSVLSNGSFEATENEHYRRTVNVLICRRHGGTSDSVLDREAVKEHIHRTNDEWFQKHHPMLTRSRKNELWHHFQLASSAKSGSTPTVTCCLDLTLCYDVLFTEAEREHLTYEHFLEDWNAFLQNHPNLPRGELSFDTAVSFLQEMQ